LQKPDKIFLENINLHYALSPDKVDKGTLRESFFLNQVINAGHSITLPLRGDFVVNEKFTVEIGGRGKTADQIADTPDSWIVADEIETGAWNKIPLWLFGLLY
jgi:hypothetical protein